MQISMLLEVLLGSQECIFVLGGVSFLVAGFVSRLLLFLLLALTITATASTFTPHT